MVHLGYVQQSSHTWAIYGEIIAPTLLKLEHSDIPKPLTDVGYTYTAHTVAVSYQLQLSHLRSI